VDFPIRIITIISAACFIEIAILIVIGACAFEIFQINEAITVLDSQKFS